MKTNEFCPMCRSAKGSVFVHGHYQCLDCKQNIYPCCSGESCEQELSGYDDKNNGTKTD